MNSVQHIVFDLLNAPSRTGFPKWTASAFGRAKQSEGFPSNLGAAQGLIHFSSEGVRP